MSLAFLIKRGRRPRKKVNLLFYIERTLTYVKFSRQHLLDKLFDEQTKLFSLLEGLFVGIIGGGDKELVDLVLTVGQARGGLIGIDIDDLVEFSHPIQNVIGTGQLFALAHGKLFVGRCSTFVVKPATIQKFSCLASRTLIFPLVVSSPWTTLHYLIKVYVRAILYTSFCVR